MANTMANNIVNNVGSYYVLNGEIFSSSNAANADNAEVKTVYEVIRVIDGIPLFLEDHISRMSASLLSVGEKLDMGPGEAAGLIKRLTEANGLRNCNVKINVYPNVYAENKKTGNVQGKRLNVLMYINESHYPDANDYKYGVPAGLMEIERKDPNIKIWDDAYKAAVAEKIKNGGFYEVLIVNRDGYITEGSKSNAFFVVENYIVTAPGEHVLKGITRKYILEACKNAGLEVRERLLHVSELGSIQGAFISGTSVKALPIRSIDGMQVDVSENSPVRLIGREYDKIIEKYLKEHSNEIPTSAADLFSGSGCRKTKSRQAVMEIFEKLEIPLTADEIFIKLKEKGMGTNLSTVYRTLDMLAGKGILEKVNISDGKARYQLSKGHRHHIICTSCNKVLPIEGCPLEELEKSVCRDTSFDITGHKLELYGICPECKKKD